MPKDRKIVAICPKDKRKPFLKKPQKCSSVYVEHSSEKPVENLSVKVRKQFPKLLSEIDWETVVFFQENSKVIQMAMWTTRVHLLQTAEIFFAKGRKMSRRLNYGNLRKHSHEKFDQNVFFGWVTCSPWNPIGKIVPKGRNFLTDFPKMNKKVHTFFRDIIFLKLFLWTSELQFLQARRKSFDKRRNIFHSMSDDEKKIFSFRKTVVL